MRIALFTETFLPKIDGIVTRLRFTIRELQRGGDEVLVFAPGDGPTQYEGARIIRMPGMKMPLYPELTLSFPRASIRRELLAFSPDIIHCADPAFLGIGGIYYADVLELPSIVSYHTRIPKYLHYYGLGALEPLVWKMVQYRHRKADLNLCTSTAMMAELDSHGIKRVRLWPPAVDTELFHPQFKSDAMRHRLTDGKPDEPLLIYVGRVSAEKNIERARPVLNAIPRAHLAVVGDGPHRANLEKYFAGTNTVFAGYMQGRELAEAIASSDMLVLASKTETLGMVLLEAMAAGTVVLGANAGGIPQVVEDGVTGLLFNADDTASLPRMVQSLLDNPARMAQIRAQARVHAEQSSWAASTQQLRSFYQAAITVPRPVRVPSPFLYNQFKKALTATLKAMLP